MSMTSQLVQRPRAALIRFRRKRLTVFFLSRRAHNSKHPRFLLPSPLWGGKLRAAASSRVGSFVHHLTPPGSRPASLATLPTRGRDKRVRRALKDPISKQPSGSGPCFGQATGAPVSFLFPRIIRGSGAPKRRTNNS